MLKKAVQQGRNERKGESYASVRWASEWNENEARWKARLGAPGSGGWEKRLFQYPVGSSRGGL